MTAAIVAIGFLAWVLVGLVVVEACRIWRFWYLPSPNLVVAILWPVVLLSALISKGRDQ